MKDKESYIEGKGLFCPFCGSGSIEGDFVEIREGKAFQEMRCPECENAWEDIYHLTDVIPTEKGR